MIRREVWIFERLGAEIPRPTLSCWQKRCPRNTTWWWPPPRGIPGPGGPAPGRPRGQPGGGGPFRGFKGPNLDEFLPEHGGHHPAGGQDSQGHHSHPLPETSRPTSSRGALPPAIANTLRRLGQRLKGCEIVMEAVDAGLIPKRRKWAAGGRHRPGRQNRS